ncbi:hypothetical protein QNA08_12215 [Chelatococcus sp. SYSU_G07232]|uniref:Uncharacterized protein n=1 Tax=Chelatococcus albus TaxID=3047466 RepID=A0ABT7AHY7_9HYPH|nr:hypothetical protein [Chelatococcus sp. SYSU_G07232]MDJ1159000.1 hypothetical protein [Chelatococcus sp. SYSU_G07232]
MSRFLALGFGTVALLTPLALALAPASREPVLVVASPFAGGKDAVRLVAEADGAIIRGGGRPGTVLARSDDPGFARRLYAAGAWLVVRVQAVEGCGRLFGSTDGDIS